MTRIVVRSETFLEATDEVEVCSTISAWRQPQQPKSADPHNIFQMCRRGATTHFFLLQQCVILVIKILVLKLPLLSLHGLCCVPGVKLMSLEKDK